MKSTREKIIVLIAALAVVYGLYDFISTKSTKSVISYNPEDHQEEINKLIQNAKKEQGDDGQLKFDEYIIEKAQKKWADDPFLKVSIQSEKAVLAKKKLEKKMLDPMPIYSGYLIFGEKFFAVIDGIEYETGDMLKKPEGFVVKDATPTYVLIENKNGRKFLIMIAKMPDSV